MTFDGEQEEDNDEDKDEEEGDEEEDEEDVKEEVNLSSSQEEVLTALQMQTHCPRTAAHGPSPVSSRRPLLGGACAAAAASGKAAAGKPSAAAGGQRAECHSTPEHGEEGGA